jgi:hypothetical protein
VVFLDEGHFSKNLKIATWHFGSDITVHCIFFYSLFQRQFSRQIKTTYIINVYVKILFWGLINVCNLSYYDNCVNQRQFIAKDARCKNWNHMEHCHRWTLKPTIWNFMQVNDHTSTSVWWARVTNSSLYLLNNCNKNMSGQQKRCFFNK